MPATWITKTSFARGEVAPAHHVDPNTEEFQGGCEAFRNALCTRMKSARKRYGSEILTVAGNPNWVWRHFTYYADGLAWKIVIGVGDGTGTPDSLFLIFDRDWQPLNWVPNTGPVGPWEPGNGTQYTEHFYTAAEIPRIRGRQIGNRFYLFHENHLPVYIERGSDGKYRLGGPPIVGGSPEVVSYRDRNVLAGGSIVPEATADGYIDSAYPIFSAHDFSLGVEAVGSRKPGAIIRFGQIRNLGGPGGITPHYGSWWHGVAYSSPTRIKVDRGANATGGTAPVAGYQFPPEDWCGPWVDTLATRQINISATFEPNHLLHQTNVWNDPGSLWSKADVNKVFYFDSGANGLAYWWVTDFIAGSPNVIHSRCVYDSFAGGTLSTSLNPISVRILEIPPGLMGRAPAILSLDLMGPKGAGVTVRASQRDVFHADHATAFETVSNNGDIVPVGTGAHLVGAALFLNGGAMRIKTIVDAYTVSGRILKPFDHIGPTTRWGIGWNVHDGFPITGTEHQTRVAFGGFQGRAERTVVASRSGSPDDFTLGPQGQDAIHIDIADPHGGRVSWLESSGEDLLVGTTHAIKAIKGVPLTPTQFGIVDHAEHGSSLFSDSAKVGGSILFPTSDGTGIRGTLFSESTQRYETADLTDSARHLFASSTIAEIHVVENPDQMIVVRMADGTVRVCTFRPDKRIMAWSPFSFHSGLSSVLGFSVVRGPQSATGADELHASFRKLADSGMVAVRYAPSYYAMDGIAVPTVLTATQITIDTTLAAHLLSTPCQVMVEAGSGNVYVGLFTPNGSGQIDISSLGLASPPTWARVGLQIEMLIRLLPPTTEVFDGATQGRVSSIPAAHIFLVDSKGGLVQGGTIHTHPVPQPTPTDPVTAITGWTMLASLGESSESPGLEIVHTEPYAFEVAALNMHTSFGS